MCNVAFSFFLFFFFFLLVIDDTTKEIVYRDYVDISVAVATPRVGTLGALALVSVALGLGWLYALANTACSRILLMGLLI